MVNDWSPSTKAFSISDLEQERVVVHFWANWNGYDRQYDKMLAEMIPEFNSALQFRSLNIDNPENWPVCIEAELLNVPALVLFKYGQPHETLIGMRGKAELRAKIRTWGVSSGASSLNDEPTS